VHQFLGVGGFATYLLLGQNALVKVRDDMPLDLACTLGCGVLAGVGAVLNTARVAAGETVVVIGCGGVGLSVIQGAKLAYGRTIIAIDIDDAKLAFASEFGATHTINAITEDSLALVHKLTDGGADHVFEVVGSEVTRRDCVAMTGAGGTVTLVGMIKPETTMTVTGKDLMMGRSIQKSILGSNRFVEDIPMLVEHYLAGRLDLDRLVSARRSLDELPSALAALEAAEVQGRAVITYDA